MDKVERLRGRGKALAKMRGHDLERLTNPKRLEQMMKHGRAHGLVRPASAKDVQDLVGKASSRMRSRD